jgi:tight adherence protein B
MRAWWWTALLAAVVAVAAPVASADPARAERAPAISVTGVQTTGGAVEFFLAGRNLPPGTDLLQVPVTVTAGGRTLPSAARAVAGSALAVPNRGVVMVVDTSGSMAGARLAAARAAVAQFATAAPASAWLGLVTVSDTATVRLAPTPDRAAFDAALLRLDAAGETALHDGIQAGVDLLDPAKHPTAAGFVERRVIVLSDGADTASSVSAHRLRQRLARADAVVDAVAFGEADRTQLASITGASGGRTVPAADSAQLAAVLRGMVGEMSAPVVVTATVPPQLAGQSADLRVTADIGGAVRPVVVPVTFRSDPAVAVARTTFRAPPTNAGLLPTALVALAGALFLTGLFGLRPLLLRTDAQRMVRRLDRYAVGRRRSVTAAKPAVVTAALTVAERAMRKPGRRERVEAALERAGSSLRPAEWQLMRAGVSAGLAVVAALVLPWWLGLALGPLGGWLGSGQYLRLRAERRTRAFAAQLPDALHLVVGSLRSGFSLPQSIDALVREGRDPVAFEFGRALAETRLGGDLEDALERVGQRNGNREMQWLVMAIRIQREVGGNLSEVLETAVTTMRDRSRLIRHIRALSAEGRLSALVLIGMPIVLGAWMFVFRRDYLRPLYTEPMGLLMLGGSIVMVIIGGLWLRKLVQVRV